MAGQRRTTGRWGVVAGVALVVAYAGLCVAALIAARSSPSTRGAEAAGAFLEAWERSRNGTYVVESEFVRRSSTGGELRSPSRLAQRPPDRLVVAHGGVDGWSDDRVLLCSTDPATDRLACRTGAAERTYEESVERELAILATYVGTDDPLYTVVGDDGCFDLRRTRFEPRSPYGREARFCFDHETGAPILVRVEHDSAVDVTRARAVRTVVTDEDLQPPAAAD